MMRMVVSSGANLTIPGTVGQGSGGVASCSTTAPAMRWGSRYNRRRMNGGILKKVTFTSYGSGCGEAGNVPPVLGGSLDAKT